jgi:transposase
VRHCGIDVHLKASELCELSSRGKVVRRERFSSTREGFRKQFGGSPRMRIVMESGGSTPWVYRLLCDLGHEVVVVNPRRVRLIAESTLKSDRIDAEILARLSRFDLELLQPVHQRSAESQALRTKIQVRTSLVRSRVALMNQVKGTLRSQGVRFSTSTANRFVVKWAAARIPRPLRDLLEPLVGAIGELTDRIEKLQRELVEVAQSDARLLRLQEAPGVGPLVSLAFAGWVDRADRFARSRDVGACLGLRPIVRASGGSRRTSHISREGDSEMRWLLVQAAHASLAVHRDSALKRWGERLVERLGKKKAVVALARKLAVLLHRLWVTGESYRPFPTAA